MGHKFFLGDIPCRFREAGAAWAVLTLAALVLVVVATPLAIWTGHDETAVLVGFTVIGPVASCGLWRVLSIRPGESEAANPSTSFPKSFSFSSIVERWVTRLFVDDEAINWQLKKVFLITAEAIACVLVASMSEFLRARFGGTVPTIAFGFLTTALGFTLGKSWGLK